MINLSARVIVLHTWDACSVSLDNISIVISIVIGIWSNQWYMSGLFMSGTHVECITVYFGSCVTLCCVGDTCVHPGHHDTQPVTCLTPCHSHTHTCILDTQLLVAWPVWHSWNMRASGTPSLSHAFNSITQWCMTWQPPPGPLPGLSLAFPWPFPWPSPTLSIGSPLGSPCPFPALFLAFPWALPGLSLGHP